MREKPISTESNETLRKFIYRDNSAGGKVIFECIAKNITQADKMYQEEIGNDPEKQHYVGCSIERIDKDNE